VTERLKSSLLFLIKYAIGLGLLFWILHRVDAHRVWATLRSIPAGTLFVLELLSLCGLLFQFILWRFLVSQHSERHDIRDLLASFLAGFAFRLMLPGGHAEVSKVFLLKGRRRGKVMAFGAEKFFQTLFKIIFISLALMVIYPQKKLLLITLSLAGVFVFLFLPHLLHTEKWQNFQEKEVAYHRVFRWSLMLTIPGFLIIAGQYYLLLLNMAPIKWTEAVLVTTFIWGAGLIPISISGLGVRENLAVYFLGLYNVPSATAVGASLLIFTINVIVPAIAGVIIIIRRRHQLGNARGEVYSFFNRVLRKK